jgi:small subunit ribosomal protein S25e
MGSAKKGSLSQKTKGNTGSSNAGDGDSSKKGKKAGKDEKKVYRAEIVVTLSDEQFAKATKGSKVITVPDVSIKAGVKISAVNAYLKRALEKGTVKKVGGYSGHYIYQTVEGSGASAA